MVQKDKSDIKTVAEADEKFERVKKEHEELKAKNQKKSVDEEHIDIKLLKGHEDNFHI